MAIKDIIARGIGFTPGSVKFIVTHGFGGGLVGKPGRKRIIYRRLKHTTVPVEEVFERPEYVLAPHERVEAPEMFRVPEIPVMEMPEPILFTPRPDLAPVLQKIERDEEEAIIALLLAA